MLGRLSCPCLFLCTLLISVANDLPPLHLSARGDGFFREGRKGGEGKVEVPARFARHPSFVPDEKIRMKHRASTSFMRAWRKHQTGSRPDFPRDNVASDRIRREERSSALELKFRWFVEDALCIYGYVYVCVCVCIIMRIVLHLLILFVQYLTRFVTRHLKGNILVTISYDAKKKIYAFVEK